MGQPVRQSTESARVYNAKDVVKSNTNGASAHKNGTTAKADAQPAKPVRRAAPTTADFAAKLAELGYHFRLNEMSGECEVNGDVMDDILDSTLICRMLDSKLGPESRIRHVYRMLAGQNRYHPVTEYLSNLKWDGQDHIGRLADHFKDEHELITYSDGSTRTTSHAFLLRWLVGCVGKVLDRRQNVALVFVGGQGIGKSYFCRWLCSPLAHLHREEQLDPGHPELQKRLASTWIWEVSELATTTRRQDIGAIKHVLTQENLRFRHSYGRFEGKSRGVPTSFVGTLNDDGFGFLRDLTGNRRFACVTVTSLNRAYSETLDINQVWAQATSLYRAGETWQLTSEEFAQQTEINEAHQPDSILDSVFEVYFVRDLKDEDLKINPIDIGQFLRRIGYGGDLDKCTKAAATWLKLNGHWKAGRPKTWRGIRFNGVECDRLFGKKEPSEA